jgi:hypothetical protein
MFNENITGETSPRNRVFSGAVKSIHKYGILRWLLSLPLVAVYGVSFAILIPEYETPFQARYEDLNKKSAVEKSEITTPLALPADLFYYSSIWQDMSGENPLVNTLMTSALEYLFKSMSFLKNIQDKDEAMLKQMIGERLNRLDQEKIDELTAENIYGSISSKGEYFKRLFDQLFSRHGLKKLGAKYSETDVEIFFNLLCRAPEEKQFRRLLGAMVLNIPYYLVIKNSINEYYQNSSILIPVDLFSFTLFMMYLDEVKNREIKPTIEECRNWVFSVIVQDNNKLIELKAKSFSVQPIIREEMIMPNPGYFSKGYHPKKHRAIDIASERGTMIRSPLTGTVRYYEQSPKKRRTGNFIIIKDDRSEYSIFICHMDEKDYIEDHSTEGELAEPISNLNPDWTHPLKKGQFFQVVGNTGKSTGAHTHIQIAKRVKPYKTFDFFSVNKPFQKKFNSLIRKNSYWQVYSRNEELLLSILGMSVLKYDSTRHFTDRDPAILELYSRLQKEYKPASPTIDKVDIKLEEIPDNILHTYFSKDIQEQIISSRYENQLRFYKGLIFHLNYLLKQQVPLAPAVPSRAIQITPWQIVSRRRCMGDSDDIDEQNHERIFYQATNKYFLYKMLQIKFTPREIRDQLLSDPTFTGNSYDDITDDMTAYPVISTEERILALKKYIHGIMHKSADISFISDEKFCWSIFITILRACSSQGVPLDSNFGFFRFDMEQLQNLYQSSRFMNFPDTRDFTYSNKYDNAVIDFFLGIMELAAEEKNSDFFRKIYKSENDKSIPVLRRVFNKICGKIMRPFALLYTKIRRKELPAETELTPDNLIPVFEELIENIIKPETFESRTYAEKTGYSSAESALLYSFIYEVYLSEREQYMKLFPAEDLAGVIDAIGLFDRMFKVFCENNARKQLIEIEHSRITRELESAEKELDTFKELKKQLQENFRKQSAGTDQFDDYISRQAELFSKYVTEEEKINGKITDLEQSLNQYRNEYNLLKKEKEQMLKEHAEKLEVMAGELDVLKSKSILDQDRFRLEIRNISYHKAKAEMELSDLKNEADHLKKDLDERDSQLEEIRLLMKKYKKAILSRNDRISSQQATINELSDEISTLREANDRFMKVISNAIGVNTSELSQDELSSKIQNMLKQALLYKDQSSAIVMLQEQQKNDRRSLMLNNSLINELKDQAENLQMQLDYLKKTTPSMREKDLEEENESLSAAVRQLKDEVRSLQELINKSR